MFRMRKRMRAIVALATLVFPGSAFASSDACDTVVLPSLVTLGEPDPVESLHPILAQTSSSNQQAISLLFQPMIWIGTDYRIDWSRSLASHVDVSADHMRYTVTIRPWHWSDGTAVTSADALYAWTMIKGLGPSYSGYGIAGVPDAIRSVTAPDANTLVVQLTKPINPDLFEALGLGNFTPLPSRAWSGVSVADQQSLQTDPRFFQVVDGPFRVGSIALGRQIVFERNDRYNGHRAPFRRLVDDLLVGEDPLEVLRSGEVDAASLPYELFGAASRFHGFRVENLAAIGSYGSIVLNLRNPAKPFLDDVAVRQAIARAIDQRRIIDLVYKGQSLPQEGFVATANTGALPPELRGGGGPMSYDPDAARALLDRAGYRPGPDGVRAKDGRPLAFQLLITAGSEPRILLSQLAQSDLRRVGIAVDIKEVEFNQIVARAVGPHDGWDALFLDWSAGGYPDGTQFFSSTSPGNYGGYADPAMEKLLAAANRDAGTGPLWALERYVVQQQPMIFLPDGAPTVVVRPTLHGIGDISGPGGEFAPQYLTLDDAAACEAPHA